MAPNRLECFNDALTWRDNRCRSAAEAAEAAGDASAPAPAPASCDVSSGGMPPHRAAGWWGGGGAAEKQSEAPGSDYQPAHGATLH